MDDRKARRRQLAELRNEHRSLDEVIQRLAEAGAYDQLQLRRLKKRNGTVPIMHLCCQ
jgi:hypothetical protein